MAKKTRRRSKGGTPPTVDQILAECEAKVRTGLGRRIISKDAAEFWDSKFRKSILKRIAAGGDWEKEKKNPLRIAKKLGKVAAALTDGRTVQKWAAEAARIAVRADPSCPTGGGSGAWCEI